MKLNSNYIQTLTKAFLGKISPNSQIETKLANVGGNLTPKDKRIIDQIVSSFVSRTRQDISTWRTGLMLAENPVNPQRARLLGTYKDVKLDDQVIACTGNIKASVKTEGFYAGDADTKEKDEVATKLFERPWFYDFLDSCVDSILNGFVLLELGDLIKTNLGVEVDHFDEIPLEHVIPEKGLVVLKVGDEKGIDYTEQQFSRTIFPIGKKNSLGLLNPITPKAIVKKNVESAWAEFCEMFGMPIRVGKVASRNQADIDRMESFLKAMGSAPYAVTGSEDTIELKETSRGDAYMVYDKLMDRQDKAISKILLGQTMTTDNGSSRSQAEVHERVSEKRMNEIKLFIEFTVNFRLIPFLIANGYKLDGLQFYWDASTEVTEIDIKMDEFLVKHFEFDDLEYFKKKYRVPINKIKLTVLDIIPTDTKDSSKNKLERIQLLNDSINKLYNSHAH